MILESVAVEEVLLLLKIVFLVVLYLFIWRIVRSAARDLRLPQESMIIGPQQAAAAGLGSPFRGRALGRLVVLESPALGPGDEIALDSQAITLGCVGELLALQSRSNPLDVVLIVGPDTEVQ